MGEIVKRIVGVRRDVVPDPAPDVSYLSAGKRLKAYNAGEWSMVGVRAVAEIAAADMRETITSAGVWNIPSDSPEHYLQDVYREELEALCRTLYDLGFGEAEIAEACGPYYPAPTFGQEDDRRGIVADRRRTMNNGAAG
jgi:hypothetical protein